jgi:hypothetical protein
MKQYRCIFHYTNGQTTVLCESLDSYRALLQAKALASIPDVQRVEIWDGANCIVSEPLPPLSTTGHSPG